MYSRPSDPRRTLLDNTALQVQTQLLKEAGWSQREINRRRKDKSDIPAFHRTYLLRSNSKQSVRNTSPAVVAPHTPHTTPISRSCLRPTSRAKSGKKSSLIKTSSAKNAKSGNQIVDNDDIGYRSKAFPFQKLPPELRLKILTLSLVDDEPIKPVIFVNNSDKKAREKTLIPNSNSFLPVFLVSRSVYAEGITVAYGQNTFQFSSLRALKFFTTSCQESARWMKKVELNLKMYNSFAGSAELWALLQPRYIKLSNHSDFMRSQQADLQQSLKRMPLVSHLKVSATLCVRQYPNQTTMPLFVIVLYGAQGLQCKIDFDFLNPHYKGGESKYLENLTFLKKEIRTSLVASLWVAAFFVAMNKKIYKLRGTRRSMRLIGGPSFGKVLGSK